MRALLQQAPPDARHPAIAIHALIVCSGDARRALRYLQGTEDQFDVAERFGRVDDDLFSGSAGPESFDAMMMKKGNLLARGRKAWMSED